jgi:hypothetical protein
LVAYRLAGCHVASSTDFFVATISVASILIALFLVSVEIIVGKVVIQIVVDTKVHGSPGASFVRVPEESGGEPTGGAEDLGDADDNQGGAERGAAATAGYAAATTFGLLGHHDVSALFEVFVCSVHNDLLLRLLLLHLYVNISIGKNIKSWIILERLT